MTLSRNPCLQRTRVSFDLKPAATKEDEGTIRALIKSQRLPEGFPHTLSEIWHTLKEKLGNVLDTYSYYSEKGITNDMITNFTPEIMLQEGYIRSKNAINCAVDSIRESANKMTAEITLSREHIGYNPPILIEVCDFISRDGYRTGDISSAVREYSEQNIDLENPGHLIKSALPVKEVLSNHTEEKPYGVLFRQYGQNYDKKTFRESKKVPYKVFTAVLYVNKDGTPL